MPDPDAVQDVLDLPWDMAEVTMKPLKVLSVITYFTVCSIGSRSLSFGRCDVKTIWQNVNVLHGRRDQSVDLVLVGGGCGLEQRGSNSQEPRQPLQTDFRSCCNTDKSCKMRARNHTLNACGPLLKRSTHTSSSCESHITSSRTAEVARSCSPSRNCQPKLQH